jgi:hypothetical protein
MEEPARLRYLKIALVLIDAFCVVGVYPQHRGHLLGDVPVLLIATAVLALLNPRGKIGTVTIRK